MAGCVEPLHDPSVARRAPVGGSEGSEPFVTPLQQVICSCAGAFISSTCTTPLDVVKIRLQAQQKEAGGASAVKGGVRSASTPLSGSVVHSARYAMEGLCLCAECSLAGVKGSMDVPPAARTLRSPHFTGAWDALFKIARSEGVTVLWSGLPTVWVMAVPATVVYFTTYDQLKYKLGYNEADSSTLYIPVIAGCMARLFAATLISPLEMLRTKMQSTSLSYAELHRAVSLSVRSHGAGFMMRGLGPSLLRDVPFSAIYWLGYESVKAYNRRQNGLSDPTLLQTFGAGAICGMIAAVLTVPFDVVKTHRQIELGEALSGGSVHRMTSSWTLISELYRKNGASALYAGLAPRVIKVTPACAIMISVYEYGKAFIRARNAQRQPL